MIEQIIEPILSVNQLGCIRQERLLFKNLSFDVYPGDIVQLLGFNGVGKSSCLSILSGLSEPDWGSVIWKAEIDNDTNRFSKIVHLGHKNGLGAYSVQDQLETYGLMYGLDKSTVFNETLTALHKVGLEALLNSSVPVQLLSQGQKRRLAFVRVLLSKAKIWILDEPFAAVDAQGLQNFEVLINEHAKAGGVVILTSHQPCYYNKQIDLGAYACHS